MKAWHIGQCSIAAGLAWWLARDVIGHPQPFFAPIVAVVCLGTSYGQRLRRVAEVTIGVAVGVFLADLLVLLFGTGPWQLSLVVALSMATAFLLNAGTLFVTQVAVQSIVVVTLVASPGYALTRWTDALIGGTVALVAAAVVPRAPYVVPGNSPRSSYAGSPSCCERPHRVPSTATRTAECRSSPTPAPPRH